MLMWRSRVVLGDFADAVDLVGPKPGVVGLEGVVEAVLPEPQSHQLAARFASRVDSPLRQIDRFAPHRRIGIGERADLEGGVGVIAHREAVDGEAEIANRVASGARVGAEMVGIVEVDVGQARNLRRPLRQFKRRRLAVSRRPVSLRFRRK